MTEADEELFMAFLRRVGDIRIFVTPAPDKEHLCLDRLPPRSSGKKQFFIWNTRFPWTPDYAVAANGLSFIRDIQRAPVIEYGRDSFRGTGEIGRLYWSKGTTPDGPYTLNRPSYTYAYDAVQFERWYKQVVQWIKSHSKPKKAAGGSIIYYLPSAWLWHGWYKSR